MHIEGQPRYLCPFRALLTGYISLLFGPLAATPMCVAKARPSALQTTSGVQCACWVSVRTLDGLTGCEAANMLIGPNDRYRKHVLGSGQCENGRIGSRDWRCTASNTPPMLNPASNPAPLLYALCPEDYLWAAETLPISNGTCECAAIIQVCSLSDLWADMMTSDAFTPSQAYPGPLGLDRLTWRKPFCSFLMVRSGALCDVMHRG